MLSLFCMTWLCQVSSDNATVPTGKHLTLIMMLVLKPAHLPFMNYKHFKFDSRFIFNMISKCLEMPQHDKILVGSELLFLRCWTIKCGESLLSDCDNHGISKERVEALYNDGFRASCINNFTHMCIFFIKRRFYNVKSYQFRHILKLLCVTIWCLILLSHLKHKGYLIEFIYLKFQLFPK